MLDAIPPCFLLLYHDTTLLASRFWCPLRPRACASLPTEYKNPSQHSYMTLHASRFCSGALSGLARVRDSNRIQQSFATLLHNATCLTVLQWCPLRPLACASFRREYNNPSQHSYMTLHASRFCSGALSGLTRVRRFQQDDAHIFCRPDQVRSCPPFVRTHACVC
jgi:hypothetical protein